MKLAQSNQMQRIDRSTIEEIGIPGVVLMENAGKITTSLMADYFGSPEGKKTAIFCGPGNNGGDGFVIARHLQQMKADVLIYLLVEPEKIKGDAAINLSIARKLNIPFKLILDIDDIKKIDLTFCYAVVDALFGTGLKRNLSGHFAATVQIINDSLCPVVAVDIPSGVDSDNGKIKGISVRADLTATYGLAKPGHFVFPGKNYVGILEIIDIGIPFQVSQQIDLHHELLDEKRLRSFLPERVSDSHKGSHGHLLIIAGSTGKTGAAILTGLGALRVGSGLVSLCIGRNINTIIESALFEAMTLPVEGGSNGAPSINDYDKIHAFMASKQAMVLGPGLGTTAETAELVEKIYTEAQIPLVVDADALNILAERKKWQQKKIKTPRILTPHPGEMARLIGSTSALVQEDRLQVAQHYAQKHNVYLILKGAGTIIASPNGSIAINPTGNAGMAAGGMGDVLSGIIGGMIAQGLDTWQACCLAVFIHGAAADHLATESPQGYLASEVANAAPQILNKLRQNVV